jgi:hypothetical protein
MSDESSDEFVPPTAAIFVRRLRALQNPKEGLPISSHRARVGRLIVAGKKAFRTGFQPFINEVLNKQAQFNEAAVHLSQAIYRDFSSLEGGVLAMREAQNRRIAQLEADVRSLQQELTELRSKNAPTAPPRKRTASR